MSPRIPGAALSRREFLSVVAPAAVKFQTREEVDFVVIGSGAAGGAMARELSQAGFSVVAYDAPAHGASTGRITAAPEMARVMSEVASRLGGLHGVVGHSIGGAATLLAVRGGLSLERAVLLAPPSDLRGFVERGLA